MTISLIAQAFIDGFRGGWWFASIEGISRWKSFKHGLRSGLEEVKRERKSKGAW